MVTICEVLSKSRAARAGIRKGDVLVSINGHEIRDVLDYRFYLAERKLSIAILRDGKAKKIHIRKHQYDDIGLDFETPLMDKKHSCENKCVFCFIDQLPKGMRPSLYFKDDDSRLSFLHGNYITLTNLKEQDIERIIEMHISPINISVHTTNPELRIKMMKNKRSGEVLSYMKMLADATTGLLRYVCTAECGAVRDEAIPLLPSEKSLIKNEDGSLNTGVLIMIIAGALLVIGGTLVTLYFTLFKKKRASDSYKYNFNTLGKK